MEDVWERREEEGLKRQTATGSMKDMDANDTKDGSNRV